MARSEGPLNVVEEDEGQSQTGIMVIDPTWLETSVGIDVVAIHGLCGHRSKTWATLDNPERLWLHDAFLEGTSFAARVISYGYNPSDGLKSCYTISGIYQMAEELLAKLLELRSEEIKDARRPIFWVSHDVGGMVVKAALVLAHYEKEKYADILRSTRVLIFFGCPHRSTKNSDLQEQLLRLLSLRLQLRSKVKVASALSQTVSEINGAFIHTQMLTQAILLNSCSSHPEISESVFSSFTASFGVDGEIVLNNTRSHLDLPSPTSTTAHPLKGKPDSDWRWGDWDADELQSMQRVLNQIPPTYPLSHPRHLLDDYTELKELMKPDSWNRIVHIRCETDAKLTSEECFRALQRVRANIWQFQFYFNFNSDDIRFSSLEPWFASICSHIVFSRTVTFDPSDNVGIIGRYYPWTLEGGMAYCWTHLITITAVMDAVYVLGCFDECRESQALWLISQIGRQIRSFEEPLKIVIVTTKNSNHGHKITEALSQLPEKSVTTLDYSGAPVIPPKENLDERFELPVFLQEDPRYAEGQTSETIQRMYASCRADGDLGCLLLTLMKSSPDSMKTMQLFQTDLPLREQIFTASLEAISAKNRSRALKVISWLLTFRRPLRVFEFVALHELPEFVCNTGCLQHSISRKDPRMSYKAGQILRDFGGLLHVKDDEVCFSHPQLRSWLLSVGAYSTLESQWFHLENEFERHADTLDFCVKCLSHLNGDERTDGVFAYAVEHWAHHYIMANGLRHNAILNNIFGDLQLLNNWIAAYGRLQTPFVKPRPGASKPLSIAAHFGLDSIVKSLITKESINLSIWSEATLESVRMGHLSTLLVLYKARPTELEFDNDVLHDIVKEAALSGHSDVFREVVQRIPEAPHEKPGWKAITMRPAEKHVPHSGEHELSEAASHSPPRSSSGAMAQDASESKRRQQELLLTQTTEDDEGAGKQNKNNELRKICTDMDHYGEPSQEQGSNPRNEDQESKSPIGSSPPAPITPFDWLHLILCYAARYGVQDAVARLLSLGANVNAETTLVPKFGKANALAQASRRGHLATMRSLLDHGADLELTAEDTCMTPLMFAVQGGNRDVVKLLLEEGADVKATDSDNWMAVHHASFWGCYAVLKTLIQQAPQIEHMDTETPPPLLQAARRGRYTTMKILLENGVGANSADEDQTALTLAIRQGRCDICELLLNGGEGWTAADPNFAPENSGPPLVGAVWTCNLDIVKLLLEKGADIQKADERGRWYRTPLSLAIGRFGTYLKIDIIKHLLENKADPLVTDEDGWTPLWTSVNEGHAEVARVLLTAGAAPSLETPCGKNGWKPLCTAVSLAYTDVIQVLVEFGADVNKEVKSGATSVALAVGRGDAESLRHLLSSPGQKPDLKHPSVKSALLDQVRRSEHCLEALDMVLAAGAHVDMVEQTGTKATLLMAAMANPTSLTNKLAQTILMYGPSVDIKDEFGNTVLTNISPHTSVSTIKILLRRGAKLDVNSSGQGPLIAAIEAGNMDVFKFWLTQDVVKSSVNTPSTLGTSLHHAVWVDNIEMVKTLIQHHGANIDFSGELNYGTPIMMAIFPSQNSIDIVKMLLDGGAQLTRPAGLLSFPINVASLTAPPSVIRLLLDRPGSGVSIDVRDQFERKPAHLACHNSLEAFNELCIPDGDFAAKDRVGRVPLHYAALAGNVKVMEVVLERSRRVGVDINVEDDDGWTPLLWAARSSKPTWSSSSSSSHMPQEMIEYLLNIEAIDATVRVGAIGADKNDKSWSAADIAEYSGHEADSTVISLLRGRVTEKDMSSTGRGKRGVDAERYCDCCLAHMHGIYFRCLDCDTRSRGGFDLCFKCAYSKCKLHPSGHRLSKFGEEVAVHDELDTPVLEGGNPAPQDLILDQPVYEGEDDAADATETDMIDDMPEYENGDDSDDQ